MAFTDRDKQRVQGKWNLYMDELMAFRALEVDDPEIVSRLEALDAARQDVWLEVALVTKDINPSMEDDVRRGGYKHNVSYLRHHFDVEV